MDLDRPYPHRPNGILCMLNPEAGNHPMCHDPRELQAALRAGRMSWRRFPYYEARYGGRGLQFARSDSAWLVALAELHAATVNEQIAWLGRVLASRGMPQWLLELHLGVLYTELVAAVPERTEIYCSLLGAATMLREQRRKYLDDAALAELTAAFALQVGAEWEEKLPETGALLASAVADEAAGIMQAVPSIASWMTEPQRFPSIWIASVNRTLGRARAHVRRPYFGR